MDEKMARMGIRREKDHLYYVKDGAVWKVVARGAAKGAVEKVLDVRITMEPGFLYFIDKDGDVSRAVKKVGGRKRVQREPDDTDDDPFQNAPSETELSEERS